MPLDLAALARARDAELVTFRHDLHAHPELGRREHRTTDRVCARLEAAGLHPRRLTVGTGLVCDIGRSEGPTLALRADLDALPLEDEKTGAGYRSTVKGVCHACGHDVHTTVLLGAGIVLAGLAGQLAGRVRLVFQPAEERTPGGALDVIREGHLRSVGAILGLHCDPRLTAGLIGMRAGPITAASDMMEVRLRGPGGHTARPQLTADVVHAAGKVISELPGTLSRLVDPRAGLSVTFGAVHAGEAPNVMPRLATLRATLRVLDVASWRSLPDLIPGLVRATVAGLGVEAEVDYITGVPPVHNDALVTAWLRDALEAELGFDAVTDTPQSLGGEDFGWYLDEVPGSFVRLGVGGPGCDADLHTPTFDIDEAAIVVGVRTLTAGALRGLAELSR
ncbi:MAG: M20 family metallopeptidase [Candidatus Dormibacteria bacterium]